MNYRKIALPAVLAAVLLAAPAASAAAAPMTSGHQRMTSARSSAGAPRIYNNLGYRLQIPAECDHLLLTTVCPLNSAGKLFTVSEKASMAASGTDREKEGMGWLFSIARISEAKMHNLVCMDMSGAELFARDDKGNYFIYYHPTDVRFHRKTPELMKQDASIWSRLTQWADVSVRKTFLKTNPGLTPMHVANDEIGLYMARITYNPASIRYRISTTEYGPMEDILFDPDPYAEKLLYDVTYETVPNTEAPDGEYVVLDLPDEKIRLDFFLMDGAENIIRKTDLDGNVTLYRAIFRDNMTLAGTVMHQWYEAMVHAAGK